MLDDIYFDIRPSLLRKSSINKHTLQVFLAIYLGSASEPKGLKSLFSELMLSQKNIRHAP